MPSTTLYCTLATINALQPAKDELTLEHSKRSDSDCESEASTGCTSPCSSTNSLSDEDTKLASCTTDTQLLLTLQSLSLSAAAAATAAAAVAATTAVLQRLQQLLHRSCLIAAVVTRQLSAVCTSSVTTLLQSPQAARALATSRQGPTALLPTAAAAATSPLQQHTVALLPVL
jgi:hypothetical protein